MKIVQVEFVESVTINGTKVLAALGINPSKYPGVKLNWTDYGLTVSTKDGAGKPVEAIVPHANIRMAILEPVEELNIFKKK